jgi:hypothetical protein
VPSIRRASAITAMVIAAGVAACSTTPAATGPAATAPGATPAASTLVPTAAMTEAPSPTAAALSPEALSGTWKLVSSNARVLSATGDAAGGTVTLQGGRYVFQAGDYRSEGPTEFDVTTTLECTARGCRAKELSPVSQLLLIDDQLRIGNPATLALLGAFGGRCGWADIPDAGLLKVVETGSVNGQTVPTVVSFVAGTAGGVGTDCADASWVVAWDVTATRQ